MSCLYWLHCWHTKGEVRPSAPPVRDEVCCYCGDGRTVEAVKEVTTKEHGQFAPKLPR